MKFLKKAVGSIGMGVKKFVTRDVPHFVTKTVPEGFKHLGKLDERETWRPELVRLRKEVVQAEKVLPEKRSAYFALRRDYAERRLVYLNLSEDYQNRRVSAALPVKATDVPNGDWDDPACKAEERLQHIENGFRSVLGFVTFDLSEAAWAGGEAKKELSFLRDKLAALRAAIGSFSRGIIELQQVQCDIENAIEQLSAQLGGVDESGLAKARDLEQLQQGMEEGQLAVVQAMLHGGASIAQVEIVTGLEASAVERVQASLRLTDASAPMPWQRRERALELLADGIEEEQVRMMTGLSQYELSKLREGSMDKQESAA